MQQKTEGNEVDVDPVFILRFFLNNFLVKIVNFLFMYLLQFSRVFI